MYIESLSRPILTNEGRGGGGGGWGWSRGGGGALTL